MTPVVRADLAVDAMVVTHEPAPGVRVVMVATAANGVTAGANDPVRPGMAVRSGEVDRTEPEHRARRAPLTTVSVAAVRGWRRRHSDFPSRGSRTR